MKLLELINRSNLDMSKKARLARAESMGFDTSQVWYHANTGGIEGEGFDDARLPAHDPDRPFNAHWFSHEPSEHAAYPSSGNTITPVFLALRKEAPHGVWRKLTAQVHKAWDKGDNERNAADVIREKLVSMGYTHAVRGREPIDAEELKRTGETSFMTSTGTKVTLKWEKMMVGPVTPEYTEEELENFKAYTEAKRMYDTYHTLVIDTVMDNNMTPEKSDELKAKGIELKNNMDRLKVEADAADDRAYEVVNSKREEIDSLEMYDSDVGHVTGYGDLADFEASSPEKEDIAVLDPSIIRSIHAEFDPNEAGSKNIMSSIGEDRNMENEARLARAKAMGFDTSKVYYHGTMKDFAAFSKEGNELNFGGAQNALGHFFASRPNYAGLYAGPVWNGQEGGPNIIPVFLRGNFKAEDINFINDIEQRNSEDYYAGETEEWVREIRDDLEREGYDGINFGNGYEIAVFDEKNIRSIHAQFSDSNNNKLMAGKGLIETLGPHQDKELKLMLKGEKPIAMIDQVVRSDKEMAGWWHANATGKVVHKIGKDAFGRRNDLFALPGEEWRAEKIDEIYQMVRDNGHMTKQNHIDLGKLLGYSDADIEEFIKKIGYHLGESEVERKTPTVAYHATYPENRDNIRIHGLDPRYSDAFEDGGAVFFATGATPDPKMDIWKVDLSGLPIEYDNDQVTGEPGWGENEHWWYTTVHVVPDRLKLVQKGKES